MSKIDIFAKQGNDQVASMLNQHLRWKPCSEDNFVSWTSSLLYALQYSFFSHASEKDGSTFSKIQICIIDTTGFAKGIFIQDIDLIQAYRSFSQ